MNVEEKIKRKESRNRFLKNILLPAIIGLCLIVLLTTYLIKNKNEKMSSKNENMSEEIENTEEYDKQMIGINNGTSQVQYKGYIYA